MRAIATTTLAALGLACAREVPVPVVALPLIAARPPLAKPECLPTSLDTCHEMGRRALSDDPRTAFEFQSLACEGGVPKACADLGWMKLRGVWGESNPATAFDLLAGACKSGVLDGCVTLGALYRDARHDDAAARSIFVHYCNDLDAAAACDELGRMVEDGRGFAKDADAAQRLYEHACKEGAGAGCGDLGRMVIGVDAARGHALLKRGCLAADGRSCFELALRARNPGRALAHYEHACNLGVGAACAGAAAIVDPEQRSPKALWWLSRACDEEDAAGCRALAERVGSSALFERAVSIESR